MGIPRGNFLHPERGAEKRIEESKCMYAVRFCLVVIVEIDR